MTSSRAQREETALTAGLPTGWTPSTLGAACEINPPKPKRGTVTDTLPVTFVPMPAVDADLGTIKSPLTRPYAEVAKGFTAFRDEDVIMAKITPCMENGKAAIARGLTNGLGFGSTEFHVLRSRGDVLPEFVYYFIRQESFRSAAEMEMTGSVGQKRVPADFIENAEIPIPPLPEQARIVEAIKRLTARTEAARDRLSNVPSILKRFRQSVLAAACSGRLTEDWRSSHSDTEPAESGLRRFDRSRPKRKAKESDEDELDVEMMPALPETWAYRRADTIVAPDTIITYGIVLPGPEVQDGVPYVRQQDIQEGGVLIEQLRRTTPAIAAKHDRAMLAEGDVLLCIIRHLRVATVPRGLDGANLTQGTVRMRPSEVISGPYLARFLASEHAQAWMKQRHFGMSMPRINVEHARAIPVAVPPMAEQAEIVRRVDSLMKLADAIERRVTLAQTRADKLTQSILAKAFRGELVSQQGSVEAAVDTLQVSVEPLGILSPPETSPAAPLRITSPAGPRSLPKGIYFTRGAIACYIIERLHKQPTFGRVEFEKSLFLTETHVGVDLYGQFKREAAGPLDGEYLNKLESLAKKQGWFTRHNRPGGKGYTYQPGPKCGERTTAAVAILGDRKPAMDHLLDLLAKMNTEQAEIMATLFAAWNDLLILGRSVTDAAIIAEVRDRWHEAKKRFQPARLQVALDWMRQHGLAPTGIGSVTVSVFPNTQTARRRTGPP